MVYRIKLTKYNPVCSITNVDFNINNTILTYTANYYIYFGMSGTGIRQSQAKLEKPGGTTKQGWDLTMKCQLDNS